MLKANGREVKFPRFNIVWIGEAPNNNLCVGSDDGRIRIVGLDSAGRNPATPISASGDAINSVAFLGPYVAASSRSEVTVVDTRKQSSRQAVFNVGAYGLTGLGSGRLVAACGEDGLLIIDPNEGKTQVSRATGHVYEYYKAIELGTNEESDLIVAATRDDGILTQLLSGDAGVAFSRSITFPGLDIIDVAMPSPSSPIAPLAVLAASADGSLHFLHDCVRGTNPTTVTFPGIEGVAYKVAWIENQIVLLTSHALYRFPGLGDLLLKGEKIKRKQPVARMPIDAIDIAVLYGRYLAVVLPDQTVVFERSELMKRDARYLRDRQHQDWIDAIPGNTSWRIRTDKKFVLEPSGVSDFLQPT